VTVSSTQPVTERKLTTSPADENSAFPAGVNAAATWSTRLMKNRGQAMGAEHAGKGVDVQLGPVAGPIGRVPEGGRNWEGLCNASFDQQLI
jgi:beta-glucosidase-like glycosyl hydrolase